MAVMDDFVAHIDRRAIFFQALLNNLNGAVNACAKAARASQHNP
jgi:hypothetical protein